MQQAHLRLVGDEVGHFFRYARVRVDGRHVGQRALEGARDSRVLGRVTGDVDGWGGVGVDRKRRGDALVGRQQASQVATDFADLSVRARHGHAVTGWRVGRTGDQVVALVGGEDEQRVGRGNPIRL